VTSAGGVTETQYLETPDAVDACQHGDVWPYGSQMGAGATSIGSEHRQRSSCLVASILMSTPREVVQGDTGIHGRNPALVIPVSRRPWAPEKRPH